MKIIEKINKELENVFDDLGFDKSKAIITLSNLPQLCDFQCNACFGLAKELHISPREIALKIVERYNSESSLMQASFAGAGFVNFVFKPETLIALAEELLASDRAGIEVKQKKRIIVDYGGANIAKPLHVGHLRSAVIGEAVKRIAIFCGDEVIGDAHLGDWGLQMGLVIAQFLEDYDCSYYFAGGNKPEITMDLLNEIYPKASARSKIDELFKQKAKDITVSLQHKEKGIFEIYQDIRKVSISSVDGEYKKLNVFFDLFYGESDAEPFTKPMLEILENKHLIKESQGASIVEVATEDDREPMPPVIVKSSAGSDLYATTDLATILMRMKEFNPNEIWYITDDRQSLHFKQVFRVANMAGFTDGGLKLMHFPFGTVNGTDGKPFKTREGGVMKLGDLYQMITNKAEEKIKQNGVKEENGLSRIIGVASLKFGDLINFRAKDYVFDLDKFTSFEGKTGPYILYSAVRIKSILKKCAGFEESENFSGILGALEKDIIFQCLKFDDAIWKAYDEKAPNYIAQGLFDICQSFSTFYNSVKIISEENKSLKNNYINICKIVLKILEIGLNLLAIDIPEKM